MTRIQSFFVALAVRLGLRSSRDSAEPNNSDRDTCLDYDPGLVAPHPDAIQRTCSVDIKNNKVNLLEGFNVLTATAGQLGSLLDTKQITSQEIVQVYLRQIERHNSNGLRLNAIISIAPESLLLEYASTLDGERAAGKLRGPYHGIPIVVKDTINIDPSLGMKTTLGSYATRSSRPARNAVAIEMLLKYGLILLGKANLTEFGTNKSKSCPTGWSPVGGQTQSPYIKGGVIPTDEPLGLSNPGGSSSGSTVAVAAGFVPWSIGAETDGSLQTPASRSSLYALKPSVGSVSGEGVFRLAEAFDSLGGMAKSAEDLASLTEILFTTMPQSPNFGADLKSKFRANMSGLTLRFVDIDEWQLPPSLLTPDATYLEQRRLHWQQLKIEMRKLDSTIVEGIRLKKPSEYTFNGTGCYSLIRQGGFQRLVEAYFNDLAETEVHTLSDIVQFSEDHPHLELPPECPDQSSLIATLKNDTSSQTIEEATRYIREVSGPGNIDRVMSEHNLDVIIAPTDSPFVTIAAFTGYPMGTMPLGYLEPSGRPHGLSILAGRHNEALILGIMYAYETSVFKRRAPPYLNDQASERERPRL